MLDLNILLRAYNLITKSNTRSLNIQNISFLKKSKYKFLTEIYHRIWFLKNV